MDGALDSKAEGEDGDKNSDDEAQERDITKIDFQLARAIDLLQGLSVFGQISNR